MNTLKSNSSKEDRLNLYNDMAEHFKNLPPGTLSPNDQSITVLIDKQKQMCIKTYKKEEPQDIDQKTGRSVMSCDDDTEEKKSLFSLSLFNRKKEPKKARQLIRLKIAHPDINTSI